MAKTMTAIRIEGPSIEALKRIAAIPESIYSERTVSWLICRAVKEFIERNEPKAKQDAAGKPPKS
jgi:hypothetical protein